MLDKRIILMELIHSHLLNLEIEAMLLVVWNTCDQEIKGAKEQLFSLTGTLVLLLFQPD